jgi:hypothetical protein
MKYCWLVVLLIWLPGCKDPSPDPPPVTPPVSNPTVQTPPAGNVPAGQVDTRPVNNPRPITKKDRLPEPEITDTLTGRNDE